MLVGNDRLCNRASQGSQSDTNRIRGAVRLGSKSQGAVVNRFLKTRARGDFVNQIPLLSPFPTQALRRCTKEIGPITPHVPFVDEPRQAAGSGQDRKQR